MKTEIHLEKKPPFVPMILFVCLILERNVKPNLLKLSTYLCFTFPVNRWDFNQCYFSVKAILVLKKYNINEIKEFYCEFGKYNYDQNEIFVLKLFENQGLLKIAHIIYHYFL